MKKRTLGLLILVLVVLLLWWRWPGFHSAPANAIASVSKTAAEKTSAPAPDGKSPTAPTSAVTTPTTGTTAPPQSKLQILHELAQKSNKPIQFYGLVIDQDGSPISNVKVTLEIRTTKEPMSGKIQDVFEHPVMMTDAQGRFAITDAKGALLAVQSLEKVGYVPSSKAFNHSYWYWSDPREVFHPNADKPEIFHMWKKAGAERLVRKGISAPLRYDGTSSTFDLFAGHEASNGDMRVTLVRNPQQITYGQRNYEWTLTVESLGGGLIESNDEQMYRAPAEGYQPKLVIHMPADAADWTDEKSFNLYLKFHDGKEYGRAELKALIGSDRQTTPFYITSFINPTGSRNLEYDSMQNVVKPKP